MMHWIHWIWGGLSQLFSYPYCEKILYSPINLELAGESDVSTELILLSPIYTEVYIEGDLCW